MKIEIYVPDQYLTEYQEALKGFHQGKDNTSKIPIARMVAIEQLTEDARAIAEGGDPYDYMNTDSFFSEIDRRIKKGD